MCRAAIGMVLALGLLVSLALAAPSNVRYVAPTGDDSWSGALAAPNAAGTDGPFRTLRRAQDEVRRLKAADRWTGEWALPLSLLGATGKGAPTFRLNFGLNRTSTTEWIAWAGTNAQNWVVGNAGLIVLQ